MTTQDKNAEIARWMGVWQTEDGFWYIPELEKALKLESLKYHSDWNWLMDCVSKIESLGFIFSIKEKSSAIKSKVTEKYVFIRLNGEDDSKIESVYNNCLDFIVWYNTQVNQNQNP